MPDRRYLIPFLSLCLINFVAFFSSYLRLPVMPLYAASLGADPTRVGIINGAFMLTAGLLSIPAGMLADRLGRKPPIVIGSLAIACSSLLIPICSLPLQMAGAYVLFGAGLAAFAPAMMSLVADIVPSEKFGQAYGWYTTAGYFAMTIGPATGGLLAESVGLRTVFAISGGLTLAVTLTAAALLPRGRGRHRSELHTILGSSMVLLRNHHLQACLLATVGSCIGYGIFLTFLPLSAVSHGLVPGQVGIIFAAQAMTNVISRIPIGTVADKVDRRWIVAAGLIVLSLALGGLGGTDQLAAMLVCAVVLGIGMALIYTAVGALIAEQVPPVQRGLAMGMYHSCVFLGMMAGATTIGIALKRISFSTGYLAGGGMGLCTLLGFIALSRSQRGQPPLSSAPEP
ncbi:MFS transporter [Trichlorobacter ammonificans]|uniref:Major facilitator superfamily MFS_1 n=1 Tax=Trichlorobacter ammonificans TaxID=2916410 RepID=A0ABN8HFX1_9BACT|nr:MFS transporter [Trichlorobacter ammonificans]CAH2031713.1 Major facilitator superfamily MFS_1 [Trichlorobacter ammonificans]